MRNTLNMANDINNENSSETKIQFGMRIDNDLFGALSKIATKEDRSVANTIAWLLKQTPQIQELLEAEPATASVN